MTAAADMEVREEVQLVEAWRAEQLEMAGYGAQAAAELAARHDVDLHGACALLTQGCPPGLALQILL
jgi:hypothetical protein